MTVVMTMSSEHQLVCRDCGERERFPTLRAMRDSGWTDVSVYGVTIDIGLQEHDGLCSECRDDGKWTADDDDDDGTDEDDDSHSGHVYGADPRGGVRRCGPL